MFVFDGRAHVPLFAMPGMRERTVKIGSAGKIFSLTRAGKSASGWRGRAPSVMKARPRRINSSRLHDAPPNLQSAVAYGLAKDDSYFAGMRAELQRSRDRFGQGLTERGFSVLPSAGTYFINIDIAPLGETDDLAFCQRLVEEHGVAAIPVSAFYAEDAVKSVVRFCFAKKDATLDEALARLDKVAACRRPAASDASRNKRRLFAGPSDDGFSCCAIGGRFPDCRAWYLAAAALARAADAAPKSQSAADAKMMRQSDFDALRSIPLSAIVERAAGAYTLLLPTPEESRAPAIVKQDAEKGARADRRAGPGFASPRLVDLDFALLGA